MGNIVSIFLMALSLSVDACAAAVCCGVATEGFRLRDGLRLGLWFGGFQAGMTLLGGVCGGELNEHLQVPGGFLAFGLLAWLGGRMILDALFPTGDTRCYDLHPATLAALGVATSLDALAVGLSLPWLEVSLGASAAVIGAVAFTLSAVGGLAGRKLGGTLHRWAGCVGGGVLLGIGVHILLDVLR